PLGLGFLWIAFDKRKQGWHDKLAATVVVRPKGPRHGASKV
ncbi:MAG TPA: RDD family protein, partial [Gammaproteobacteria bacterium]|nr:RDD family protein [Gammaproteobacteria bacterium]